MLKLTFKNKNLQIHKNHVGILKGNVGGAQNY